MEYSHIAAVGKCVRRYFFLAIDAADLAAIAACFLTITTQAIVAEGPTSQFVKQVVAFRGFRAALLLERHATDVKLFVATRIGGCALYGDDAGVATWRGIAQRIGAIRGGGLTAQSRRRRRSARHLRSVLARWRERRWRPQLTSTPSI